MDPNFPAGLSIAPSVPSAASSTFAQALNGAAAFDDDEQTASIRRYGIAGRVWEAAYAMNVYISSPPGWEFDPPFWEDASSPRRMTLVELGAGTGIVSLQIANTLSERSLGDIIFMTDLPEVCPLLDDNARKHLLGGTRQDRQLKSPMLRVLPLSWGNTQNAKDLLSSIRQPCADSDRGLTHIVCSDLVYFPSLLAPLLRTLITLTNLSVTQPEVIVSYKIRSLPKEAPFWSTFGLWFTYEPVLARRTPPLGGEHGSSTQWERFGAIWDGPTFVFVARRRAESLRGWDMPDDDEELLTGVGAQGTTSRKGDGTFETLLFMSMQTIEEDAEL